MGGILIKFLLGASISGSILMLAVILLRFPLKKSAKSATLVLWGLVALRLIIPFSIQTESSIVPNRSYVTRSFESVVERAAPVTGEYDQPGGQTAARDVSQSTPANGGTAHSGEAAAQSGDTAQSGEAAAQSGEAAAQVKRGAANAVSVSDILAIIWACGAAAIAGYTLVSYIRLRRNVSASIEIEKNVFICDYISTSFAMGLFRPRIYIPSSLNEENMQYVIAHEKEHIRHKDIPIKLIGHALLAIYWFNPLAWVSYILFCRDIEFACDERTVKNYEKAEKAGYAQTLLDCKLHRGAAMAYPVAFGDTAIKERVKKVLNYKKPAVWVTVLCIALCAVLTACLATEAKDNGESKYIIEGYSAEEIRSEYDAIKVPDVDALSEEDRKEYCGKLVVPLSKIAGGDKDRAGEYAPLLREIVKDRLDGIDSDPAGVFPTAEKYAEFYDNYSKEGESAFGLRDVIYDGENKTVTLAKYGYTWFSHRSLRYESGIVINGDEAYAAYDGSLGKYRVELMLLNRSGSTVSGIFTGKYRPDTVYDLQGGDGKFKMRYTIVDKRLLVLYIGSDEPFDVSDVRSGMEYDPFVLELANVSPDYKNDEGLKDIVFEPFSSNDPDGALSGNLILQQYGLCIIDLANLKEDAGIAVTDFVDDAGAAKRFVYDDDSLGRYRIAISCYNNYTGRDGRTGDAGGKAVSNTLINAGFLAKYKPDTVYDVPGSSGKIKMRYCYEGKAEQNGLIYLYFGSDTPLYTFEIIPWNAAPVRSNNNDGYVNIIIPITSQPQTTAYGFEDPKNAEYTD